MKNSCKNCEFFVATKNGKDTCRVKPGMANLKSFPFKETKCDAFIPFNVSNLIDDESEKGGYGIKENYQKDFVKVDDKLEMKKTANWFMLIGWLLIILLFIYLVFFK